MTPLAALVLGAVAVTGAAAAVVGAARRRRRLQQIVAALNGDAAVEVLPERRLTLLTRPPQRRAWMVRMPSGLWQAYATAPRLAGRTSLAITRRRTLGRHSILTGEDALDRSVFLEGSESDVVRGVMSTPAVRAAALALFAIRRVETLHIRIEGGVKCVARDDGIDGAEARALLLAFAAFAEAVEAHAEAPPVAGSDVLSHLETAGPDSGEPVAVPVARK